MSLSPSPSPSLSLSLSPSLSPSLSLAVALVPTRFESKIASNWLAFIEALDTAPDAWAADHYPGADEYAAFLKANALPGVLPHGVDDFLDFYDARRALLIARIKEKLRTQVATVPPVEGAPADRYPTPLGCARGEAIAGRWRSAGKVWRPAGGRQQPWKLTINAS